MKQIFLASIFVSMLHLTAVAWGQTEPALDSDIFDMVRLVEDPDGQTNVRSEPSLKAPIVRQVPSGCVVTVEATTKGDWAKLLLEDFDAKPQYIHTSRLKRIDAWKQFSSKEVADHDLGVIKHEGTELRVMAIPFMPGDHKMTRNADGARLVDGKFPWGRDGGLPTQSIALTVSQNGKPISIPKAATENLYEPTMDSIVLLTPSKASDHMLALMDNSDGAGAYCVIWAFKQGKYLGRTVFGRD
jgi:hypothetical protein